MSSPLKEKQSVGNKGSNNKRKYMMEKLSERVFLICALLSVVSLLLIIGFVFVKGSTPFVSDGYSIIDFIFGMDILYADTYR